MLDSIDAQFIVVAFGTLTISLVVHEWAHAFVADTMGDDTPRRAGRLTLNPVVLWQAHPIGSLVVPLVSAAMGGLMGWGAVPVNPANVNRKWTIRQANFLISAAGPGSNVVLALIGVGLVYAVFPYGAEAWARPLIYGTESGLKVGVLFVFVNVNIFLALFNLIPVAPLDGFAMLSSYAPRAWEPALQFLGQYGMIILLLFVMYGSQILGPVTGFFFRLAFAPLLAG